MNENWNETDRNEKNTSRRDESEEPDRKEAREGRMEERVEGRKEASKGGKQLSLPKLLISVVVVLHNLSAQKQFRSLPHRIVSYSYPYRTDSSILVEGAVHPCHRHSPSYCVLLTLTSRHLNRSDRVPSLRLQRRQPVGRAIWFRDVTKQPVRKDWLIL